MYGALVMMALMHVLLGGRLIFKVGFIRSLQILTPSPSLVFCVAAVQGRIGGEANGVSISVHESLLW